jgi:hypothetical protein
MFDDPNAGDSEPAERASTPEARAKDKSDEFRTHAELAAVFEGVRKFDAVVRDNLPADVARDVQRTIGKLEKSKSPDHPILPDESKPDAARLLDLFATKDLPTNDYHVHHRPGETMIVRWLAGEQVDTFYNRLQAHFDAALEGFKEDERQATGWKQDKAAAAFLAAMDKVEVKMADRYLRQYIRQHDLFVLSTQSADEMNIAYLCDYLMNVPAAGVVGAASAPPPDEPTEKDLAWFFKLFGLRGMTDGVERMCFFTYLQKSDDDSW